MAAASSAGTWNRPEIIRANRKFCCLRGSAAFYRREMLEEIGIFDESFFLYCEDTDLGLRARWAAWECLYVPDARVEHRYSHSAGKASALKAYYVERNRLFLAVKNLPFMDLLLAPFYTIARYFWHFVFALQGRGKAADFGRAGNSVTQLPLLVLRAHLAMLGAIPGLVEAAARDEAAIHAQAIPAPDSPVLHQPAPGGRAVKKAGQPNQVMILIPAYNEEGAVADVIREVNQVMPRVPVLVVDDSSSDETVSRAKSAGGDVLCLPHHLGLGGCVQAGYKLAYELGYDYVIRVDGDGQHDPKYIPGSAEMCCAQPAVRW